MPFDATNYEGQDRLAHIEKYVGQNTAAIAVLNGGSSASVDAGNNVVLGLGSTGFASRTSGTQNVAVGVGAAVGLTSAGASVAVGYQALNSLTDGNAIGSGPTGQNIAVGAQALYVNNSRWNIAVGSYALMNATGAENVAVGAGAGQAITTATDNTAIGHNAMWGGASSFPITNLQPITGTQNTAVGAYALQSASASLTGQGNVAVGFETLKVAAAAGFNVAIGYQALTLNASGNYNVAIGHQALKSQTANDGHVAIGKLALQSITSGCVDNVAVGFQAGAATLLTTGSNNTMIGRDAGNTDGTTATANVTNATCLGWQAQATASNVIVLGSALTANRPNLFFGGPGTAANGGGGVGVFYIATASTLPTTNPTGGGILYVDAGALKYRGSGGTVTPIANA